MSGGSGADRLTAPVIITPGEPAGIGAEITLKAYAGHLRDADLPVCLMEDPDRMSQLADQLSLDISITRISAPEDAMHLPADTLGILPVTWAADPRPGMTDTRNAPAVIDAIRAAAAFAQQGRASAIVTSPIHKSMLIEAGFEHPGHIEFLGSLAPERDGGPVMMLACDALRVVPLTVHIALRDVAGMLNSADIVAKGRLLAEALRDFFGVDAPRIAVCGLNPHAGENGQFGDEDSRIIAPAISALQKDGIDAFGPLSADTLFHAEARKTYDAVLGMYHDQVLIPIKTLDFDGGVNVTLGLDFIRTSPDHGTALDIAGTGMARPDSMTSAIRLAADMTRRKAGAS